MRLSVRQWRLEALGGENLVLTGEAGDYPTQARRLFSALREADKLGCGVIYARKPLPTASGLRFITDWSAPPAHGDKDLAPKAENLN